MGRRIGILGGTFDPVHVGHLLGAQEAFDRCGLERVLFLPSGDPPHKSRADVAPAARRAEMVARAIAEDPRFELSRVELEREGKSYTVETLEVLRRRWGEEGEFFLLIGADSAADMPAWADPERVVALSRVVVMARRGFDRSSVRRDLASRMTFLDTPTFEVSSTDIRRRVRAGRPIRYLVPDAVVHYIERSGLYRDGTEI